VLRSKEMLQALVQKRKPEPGQGEQQAVREEGTERRMGRQVQAVPIQKEGEEGALVKVGRSQRHTEAQHRAAGGQSGRGGSWGRRRPVG